MNRNKKTIMIAIMSTSLAILARASTPAGGATCAEVDLKRHLCHFEVAGNVIDLNSESVKIERGGRFSMTASPVPGADSEWEGAKTDVLGGRVFLEWLIWEPPVGSAERQQLRWITYEIVHGRLRPKGNEVVQERTKNKDSAELQQFINTERDDFGIDEADGHIQWHHNLEKKTL